MRKLPNPSHQAPSLTSLSVQHHKRLGRVLPYQPILGVGGWERKFNPTLASQARDEELIVAGLAGLTPLEAEGDEPPSVPPPTAEIGFIIQVAGRRVCTDPQSGLTHVGAKRADREQHHRLLVPLNRQQCCARAALQLGTRDRLASYQRFACIDPTHGIDA